MPTAFPSGFYLERSSRLRIRSKVRVDFMDDGTPLSQQVSNDTWYRYTCLTQPLSQTDKNTLVAFVEDNASTPDVTWTIDGVSLTGRFIGDIDVSMEGAFYRLRFDYYAKEA